MRRVYLDQRKIDGGCVAQDEPVSESLAFMATDVARRQMYRYLSQWFPSDGDFLDVGCGAGALLTFAEDRGMRATGIDADPENVQQARGRGLDVVLGEALSPPFDNTRMFDVVAMVHLLEHFPPTEALSLLSDYSARLRPGGRLVLVTPNFADWSVASEIFWLDPTHVRPYPAGLLTRFLARVDLDVVHVSTETLVDLGRRRGLSRPFQRLRFGREFERMNVIVVGERRA